MPHQCMAVLRVRPYAVRWSGVFGLNSALEAAPRAGHRTCARRRPHTRPGRAFRSQGMGGRESKSHHTRRVGEAASAHVEHSIGAVAVIARARFARVSRALSRDLLRSRASPLSHRQSRLPLLTDRQTVSALQFWPGCEERAVNPQPLHPTAPK